MGRGSNRTSTTAIRRPRAATQRARTDWTHTGIRAGLQALLAGESGWPSIERFRRAGRIDLYEAVLRHGGTAFWRQAMGCAPPAHNRGSATVESRNPRRWDDEQIARQLRAFLGDHREWPTVQEFNGAGLRGMYLAIINGRGIPYWADRMSASLAYGQGGRRYTVDDAVTEACLVIAACGRLPNEKKLRALGHGRLAEAVARAGGARMFAAAHGLPESD